MKRFLTILAASVLILTGCSVLRPRIVTVIRDSTVVNYRDSLIVKDSIVYTEVPKESSSVILPVGRESHLETTLARSDAWVDSLGLHHTLDNKSNEKIPVVVQHTIHIKEQQASTTASSLAEKIVYVEKKLTKWQEFRLKSFWTLLIIVVAGVVISFISFKNKLL